MTFVYWEVQAGARLPEHPHVHEQALHILEGKFGFVVGGEPCLLTQGMLYIIPANIPHSGKALSECQILDVFHPVHEDYRQPSDH